MGTAIFVVLVVAFALGGAGAVLWLVLKLLSALGGTARLAARYGAAAEPPGTRYSGQTIAIGAVRHRHSGTLVIGPAGLYVTGAIASKPVLIPWTEVSAVRDAKIFQRRAMKLFIGNPQVGTITVYPDLFEPMRPYLGKKP